MAHCHWTRWPAPECWAARRRGRKPAPPVSNRPPSSLQCACLFALLLSLLLLLLLLALLQLLGRCACRLASLGATPVGVLFGVLVSVLLVCRAVFVLVPLAIVVRRLDARSAASSARRAAWRVARALCLQRHSLVTSLVRASGIVLVQVRVSSGFARESWSARRLDGELLRCNEPTSNRRWRAALWGAQRGLPL